MRKTKTTKGASKTKVTAVCIAVASALAGSAAFIKNLDTILQTTSKLINRYLATKTEVVLLIEKPENPADVQVVLNHPDGGIFPGWATRSEPARLQVPAKTKFSLDTSGRGVQPQHFDSVVSGGGNETVYYYLQLVTPGSKDPAIIYPAKKNKTGSPAIHGEGQKAVSSLIRGTIQSTNSNTLPLSTRTALLACALELNPKVVAIGDCAGMVVGDIDGSGLSLGFLGLNVRQGTLQPLLQKMNKEHPGMLKDIFQENLTAFLEFLELDSNAQLDWAKSLSADSTTKYRIKEPWNSMFKQLGKTDEFQQIYLDAAMPIFEQAIKWTEELGFKSERALALMYDIRIQNGRLSVNTISKYQSDIAEYSKAIGREPSETERLLLLANRVIEHSPSRWAKLVARRKLFISNGEGDVNGIYRSLNDFGITLTDWHK